MRVLFLIPGSGATQLQAMPAVAATASQLGATVQVACPPAQVSIWKLLPAVEKVLPYSFDTGVSLADWANLLGAVREPDFQLCLNLASGWPIDLLLSLTHIPTRIAAGGFSATVRVPAPGTAGSVNGSQSPTGGWPNQQYESWLRPLEIPLDAEVFRLRLKPKALEAAAAALPAGDGPLLLLAPRPAAAAADWPAAHWQALPEAIRSRLPNLRVVTPPAGATPQELAAQVAAVDVVLSSDPVITELALLTATPLVALGRSSDSLPPRQGVKGVGIPGSLDQLSVAEVLLALGMA
ncbi:lipopolysaccharide heptosyltransferase family protein [Synechococcus sp. Lug-A]|jgi:ADP-heptose:LPS heptosyltransferase|uniref:glycosyltransferase family 9 protein n=1 Tax=unclassified Synechococcus TaxID=2626047 RepID=UPI0020CCE0B4|nr:MULTISPECIES: lipopolysaccharide heptosyltransferase family protein [unclassified Synechococcus]MCP9827573.1 lipopolysaccharide heptosyltransferase family protein [Synechococcus sp. L2F]MCP9847206.1 lipopolysaccharide heptosyltransferase family protein [Synechococcus sp. Lug-A]